MIELTPQIEQALIAVCDLALKHGGMAAMDAVLLIRNAATQAKQEPAPQAKEEPNGHAIQ